MKKTIIAVLAGFAFAGSAHAHIVFKEKSAEAGSNHIASLLLMHGCDGSATVSVRVELPDGITRSRPRILPGWNYEIEMRTLETPVMLHGFEVTEVIGAIIWSGGEVPDDAYQQFDFWVALPDQPGRRLDFPVVQICEEGSHAWNEIAVQDGDPYELTSPAPFIRLAD
jgi:periplasmic copper chaperone A